MPDFYYLIDSFHVAGLGFVVLLQKLPGRGLLLSHRIYCFLNKQHGFSWKSLFLFLFLILQLTLQSVIMAEVLTAVRQAVITGYLIN